jgi:hypothetical protein
MRLRLPIPALLLAIAGASAVPAQSAAQNRPQPQPASAPESTGDFLNQVNSCDRACQDQIARAVRQLEVSTKQPASNVAEKSRQDQPWQALLSEAIAMQSRSCDLRAKKNQNASANKEIARRTSDIAARAAARIKTVSDPYLAEFMRLQLNRVWNANCPSNVAHIPSRHDPEDTDAQKDESATSDPPDDNR